MTRGAVQAGITAIEYVLPPDELTTEALAAEYPDWNVEKIQAKTGIRTRRIAKREQLSSDLAVEAARRLFESNHAAPGQIDYLLLCTQSPDYFLPTTACLVQDRLGLPTTCGALDFNLGCSGFVYGLGLAKGLIETGQASNVLLITAETYSKFIRAEDRGVRTIFGDAAAATLLTGIESETTLIGPLDYGTDGRGGENLIVRGGGMRDLSTAKTPAAPFLEMAGPEIFSFTLSAVPHSVTRLLGRAGLAAKDIDRFVFHQANAHMLEGLRRKLDIPSEKFVTELSDCGNTVSSTIPIALKEASNRGEILPGHRLLVSGFGVGYSWASAVLQWSCRPSRSAIRRD